jgi:hypothetical protein
VTTLPVRAQPPFGTAMLAIAVATLAGLLLPLLRTCKTITSDF